MYDRVSQWLAFSDQELRHIDTYTREQYANPGGQEQIESFTVEDCWKNMERYFNRRHANTRGNVEKLRDLIKVAHYAQICYDKLKAELGETDVYPGCERGLRPFEPGLD